MDADAVLVAVRLAPTTFSGPEGGENLLFAYDPSIVVDLGVFRRHQTVEGPDIKPQVGKEPFALRPEDLICCQRSIRLLVQGLPFADR